MIDARRWVLVEAWLALGLRVSWLPSYETNRYDPKAWIRDEGAYQDSQELWYVYGGHEQWFVRDDFKRRPGFPNPTAPSLSTEALSHELAHYLAATDGQRQEINFGAGDVEEEAASRAESVINAMLNGVVRIVDCFDGRPPR